MRAPQDLHVRVDAMPEPGLLRPAVEALLSGRPWPEGPEADVARAVADAVRARSTDDAVPGGGRDPERGARC